jgi:hypothetical protein
METQQMCEEKGVNPLPLTDLGHLAYIVTY